MKAIEIIIILTLISFFSILIGRYIYKKIKHIPTGECACCAMAKKNKLIKQYRKKYSKN